MKEHHPIKEFEAKYVIAPIDKTANNVAIICQRFYAEVLFKEHGLKNSNSSNIYCRVFEFNTNIIKSNKTIVV